MMRGHLTCMMSSPYLVTLGASKPVLLPLINKLCRQLLPVRSFLILDNFHSFSENSS